MRPCNNFIIIQTPFFLSLSIFLLISFHFCVSLFKSKDLQNPPPTLSDLEEMSIADLQEIMRQHQISTQGCIEKSDLIEKIKVSLSSIHFF